MRITSQKGVWILFGLGIAIITVGPSYYFYTKYQAAQYSLQNPTEYNRQETQRLEDTVGKLIDLPLHEDPTIASVIDASRLKDQPFFANAQNGDKVLIYTNAKKAFLYRPSTNKIVEVGPVTIGEVTPTPKPSANSADNDE